MSAIKIDYKKRAIELLESEKLEKEKSSTKKSKLNEGTPKSTTKSILSTPISITNITRSSEDQIYYNSLPSNILTLTSNRIHPKIQIQSIFTNDILNSNNGLVVYKTKLQNGNLILDTNNNKEINNNENIIKSKLTTQYKKSISSKEIKKLKLYDFSNIDVKYNDFIPLNNLWKQYMSDIFNTDFTNNTKLLDENKLLKADYHGAILTVRQSNKPEYIGINGILIAETYGTFKICSLKKVHNVPKAGTIFTFDIGTFEITLYGNSLLMRSAERSVRKFKQKNTIDL